MLLLLLASCGSSRKVEKQSEQVAVQEINLTPEQQRKYDYFFLEASRLKVKKEYTAAFDLLQHCLAINPTGSVAYAGSGCFDLLITCMFIFSLFTI